MSVKGFVIVRDTHAYHQGRELWQPWWIGVKRKKKKFHFDRMHTDVTLSFMLWLTVMSAQLITVCALPYCIGDWSESAAVSFTLPVGSYNKNRWMKCTMFFYLCFSFWLTTEMEKQVFECLKDLFPSNVELVCYSRGVSEKSTEWDRGALKLKVTVSSTCENILP